MLKPIASSEHGPREEQRDHQCKRSNQKINICFSKRSDNQKYCFDASQDIEPIIKHWIYLLILNPKFHSFKSTGFESIIELFRESCCNHLKCVSGFFDIVHIAHSDFKADCVQLCSIKTMSTRPEPFVRWPMHTNAACSMRRLPIKQKYPSNSSG